MEPMDWTKKAATDQAEMRARAISCMIAEGAQWTPEQIAAMGGRQVKPGPTLRVRLPTSFKVLDKNACPPLTQADEEAYHALKWVEDHASDRMMHTDIDPGIPEGGQPFGIKTSLNASGEIEHRVITNAEAREPDELRPPPEYADKLAHWLELERRSLFGGRLDPKTAIPAGWRYVGPVEPPDPLRYAAYVQFATDETKIPVTPEMIDVADRLAIHRGRGHAGAEFIAEIYRAMRMKEPVPVTPGLWNDNSVAQIARERDEALANVAELALVHMADQKSMIELEAQIATLTKSVNALHDDNLALRDELGRRAVHQRTEVVGQRRPCLTINKLSAFTAKNVAPRDKPNPFRDFPNDPRRIGG